ncbi:phage tail tape measure protein, partial [Halomonas elongata]|uniref:phage tail tape measure protein n=1 Tax=Halomonas elongata TaxID=2746 RepID=UPI00255B1C55
LAASAGVSIEEAAAAIGTLSDAGIQAERAGTGLQGIFRQLSKVTPQAKEALAGYGLSLQDVNIEANGLGPVLEKLREANISTADAFEIFGSEAGAAAQVLIHGADRVGEFSTELEDSEGAAREMALVIGSGLSGSMRSFNSALSESILQLGDSGLSSAFQSVTDTASGLLSVYNGMLPEFAEANDLTEDQERNLSRMAGALEVSAKAAGVFVGSRLAAYLVSVAAAKLAATQQAIAYQAALARMAGASRVAATATATLRGAMALVGGPIGLLVGAGGLLYAFRNELGLVSKQAEITTQRIDDLTDSINTNSKAALEAGIIQLTAEYVKLGNEAQNAQARIDELTAAQQDDRRGAHQNLINQMKLDDLENSLARINAEQQAAGDSANELREILGSLGEQSIEPTDSLGKLSDSSNSVSESAKEAARQAEQFAGSLRSLEDRLFPVEAAQRQFRQEQMLLQTALMQGKIGIERYLEAWERLEEAQRNGGHWQDVYDSIGRVNSETQRSRDSARDLGLTFTSAFEDAVIEGENFRGVLQGIFDDIQRMILRQTVTNPMQDVIEKRLGGFNFGDLFGGGGFLGGLLPFHGGGHVSSFARGGFTGSGGKYDPAGIVHAGEFVVRKSVVDQPGMLDALTAINSGYDRGGYVAPLDRSLTNPARTFERDNSDAAKESRQAGWANQVQPPIINVIEDKSRAGTVTRSQKDDGQYIIDVAVSNITSDGALHKALSQKYGLKTQGK